MVGTYDKELITKFKRVKRYSPTDFDLLVQFLVKRRVFVTPGVITEVTNMAMELKSNGFRELIESNMESLKRMGECHIKKDVILEAAEFKKVGFTDTSIIIAAKENDGEVLTADHPMSSRCRTMGIPVTHIMELQSRATLFH